MLDKMSAQQRVILATVVMFAVVLLYDFFLAPKNINLAQNATANQSYQTSSAPVVDTSAPITQTPNTQTKAPIVTQNANGEILTKVYADEYELHVDKHGRITKYFLNGENFKDENGERIQLFDSSFGLFPLEIRFSDTMINNEAFTTPYKTSDIEVKLNGEESKTVVFTQELSAVTVIKKVTFTKNSGYKAEIELSSPQSYFISPGFRPNVLADGYTFHGAIIQKNDKSIEKIADGDAKKTESFENARFVAASDRYYTSLLSNFDKGFSVLVSSGQDNDPNVFIRGESKMNFTGYIGPKSRDNIRAVSEELDAVIEYGFFTILSKPLFSLLYFLHDKIGNWGWAIVIMTLLIRLVLFPLTFRGMVSMNKLKELAPKIKELQAEYKDDKQKLNIKMMELYKKNNANPMGGCLPILIQIPIFFAIYRVLLNAIELKNAPWMLWIEDLAIRDPYFVLPILMGLTMYLQQRFTPTNFTDPMQEKIMRMLPIVFTFFFLWFPAGLTLYWFINNLFSVIQQLCINKAFEKKKREKELVKKEKQ